MKNKVIAAKRYLCYDGLLDNNSLFCDDFVVVSPYSKNTTKLKIIKQ